MNTLTAEQLSTISPSLRDPIEYRKSGLSLNHIIGCPLDCAYCVRHLFGNFQMKTPTALFSDEEAVEKLTSHRFFVPHVTPLQIFNRATDPLLPSVKPHLFRVLDLLDKAGYRNHVLIISRFKFEEVDAETFNSFKNLRITLLFTYSGISDKRIEPIDSQIAVTSLKTAHRLSSRYRVILYWRPLVPGINDSNEHIEEAIALTKYCHAIVFTGLFFREEIKKFFKDNNIPEPHSNTARRKIFPEEMEQRILNEFKDRGAIGKLFRKTSCGVAFAHQTSDYNGHYCIREICDICPTEQIARCAASHKRPPMDEVAKLSANLGADSDPEISDRAIFLTGLDEQRRYFIQHKFSYQVHDKKYPHKIGRHGRADIGWNTSIP